MARFSPKHPEKQAAGTKAEDGVHHFHHDAHVQGLAGVFFKNLFLCIVTLMLYVPVARSNIRRVLSAHVRLLGARFSYLGTGRELLSGLLLATVVIILPLMVWLWGLVWAAEQYAHGVVLSGVAWLAILVTIYGAPLVLLGGGLYQAMRYRLHRTSWRGIRFGMAPGAWRYGRRFAWLVLADICTLFLLHPILMNDLATRRLGAVRLGTVQAHFSGGAAAYFYPRYLLYWALFIPTLGISWLWYRAMWLNYLMGRVELAGMRFSFTARGWDYARYQLGNVVLLIVSLGLLLPVVWRRRLDFMCRHVVVSGAPDTDAIRQAGDAKGLKGEGLEDLLGFNLGPFGFGDL